MAQNNNRDRDRERDHMVGGPPPPTIPTYDPPQLFQPVSYSPRGPRDWNRLPPPGPGHTLSNLASESAFGNRFRMDNNAWRAMGGAIPVSSPVNLHVLSQNAEYLHHHWSRPPFLRPDVQIVHERVEEQESQEEPRPHRMFSTADNMRNCDLAVHQHFEESFRIAQQKGIWRAPVVKEEDKHHPRHPAVGPTRAPANHPGRPYEVLALKPRLELQSPRVQSGRPTASAPSPRATQLSSQFSQANDSNFLYQQDHNDRGRDSREQRERDVPPPVIREPERIHYAGNHPGKANQTTPMYMSNPVHRIKVSSPAPPQIYGKPGIPTYNATARTYEAHNEVAPLSLISKGSTRLSEVPPLTSPYTAHPSQGLKSVAHYMVNSSIVPLRSYPSTPTPSPPVTMANINDYQTQPLDLGGKRKSNSEPLNFNVKKVRNETRSEQLGSKIYYVPPPHAEKLPSESQNSSRRVSNSLNLPKNESLPQVNLNPSHRATFYEPMLTPKFRQPTPMFIGEIFGGRSTADAKLTKPAVSIGSHVEQSLRIDKYEPHPQRRQDTRNEAAMHETSQLEIEDMFGQRSKYHRSQPGNDTRIQSEVADNKKWEGLESEGCRVIRDNSQGKSNKDRSQSSQHRTDEIPLQQAERSQLGSDQRSQLDSNQKPRAEVVESEQVVVVKEEKLSTVAVPRMSSSYSVHKLKKAWLDRLTGEDAKASNETVGSLAATNNLQNSTNSPSMSNIQPNLPNPPPSLALDNSVNLGGTSVSVKECPIITGPQEAAGCSIANVVYNRFPHFRKKAAIRARNSISHTNGHDDGSNHSSSDSELDKLPLKRVKRPKGKRKLLKEKKEKAYGNRSMSESAKDSDESRDGDPVNVVQKPGHAETSGDVTPEFVEFSPFSKKRSRKPREGDSGLRLGDKRKANPFKRLHTNLLKKTGENFLQDGSCNEVAPKLGKCRECRWSQNSRSRKQSNIFCRFYAFRKLRYTKNGVIAIAGFSDPTNDPIDEDVNIWLPSDSKQPVNLELDMAKFLVFQLGDQLCNLIHQELEAQELNAFQIDKPTAWKRVVQGVREMCDVCDRTLFNYHWACGKCGFVVCISCYKSRRNGTAKIWEEPGKDRDNYQWLFCSNRQGHEDDKLMFTQVLAGDVITQMVRQLHTIRAKWMIAQDCSCTYAKKVLAIKCTDNSKTENGHKLEILPAGAAESQTDIHESSITSDNNNDIKGMCKSPRISKASDSEEDGGRGHSTLRELLIRPSKKGGDSDSTPEVQNGNQIEGQSELVAESISQSSDINCCTSSLLLRVAKDDCDIDLKYFVRPNNPHIVKKRLPIPVPSLRESSRSVSNAPHSWLCHGKLLRLHEPKHHENYKMFQEVWRRGQPVIVTSVSDSLNPSIWSPSSFSKDFGEYNSDLIDCLTGEVVYNQLAKTFWDGFENVSKRLKDGNGDHMLLKLKDWPCGEDFADVLPLRFKDLMATLPLSDYTHRNGFLNLASRLPDTFVRPDLGPKMCIAYGSAQQLNKGTINLRLDLCDAIHVLVYVGSPTDCDTAKHTEDLLKAITESGCDEQTINRVARDGEIAGALWHIYDTSDADKIRDLLNKVSSEKGEHREPCYDSILAQNWYLDRALRKRLTDEYDVTGYAVVQCLGDALLIPSGAPYQVRNLNSCIKVAEDFVSAENSSHCFQLTEELRNANGLQITHGDKLQIKSIVYHAVKDALSVLSASLMDENTVKESEEAKPVTESASINANDIVCN